MQTNFKAWLPHIVAIALFIIIPILYFLPALEGKVLFQSDIANFLGVVKEITDFRAKFHSEPLWTNSQFGGMPAYQISVSYPANLIQYLFNILIGALPFPAGIIFTMCLGFYILMNVLKANPWVSIIGSFAYAFASFFFVVLAAGHNSQANAIAFMAPTLAGIILAFNGKRLLGGVLAAISLALELYSSHLQMTYYLAIMIFIYVLIQAIVSFKQKQIPAFFKTITVLGVAAVLAVSVNITSLWLTYQYTKYSTRGKSDLTTNNQNKSGGLTIDYATAWSYGVPETMTLIMPNFEGGASEPIGAKAAEGVDPQYKQAVAEYGQYWGNQQFTSGPIYAGAIVCFFALIGFFVIKGPLKWFLFSATLLAIMLSWGKNFMWFTELFFYHVPGYNKFRSVYWTLMIAEITLPVLATLAIDYMIKHKSFFEDKISLRFFSNPVAGKKIFFASLILTAGISLLCFVMPGAFSSFHKDNEVEMVGREIKQSNPGASDQQIAMYLNDLMPFVERARKSVFTADAMRSTIFILLAAGLMWVYYKKLAEARIIIGVLLFFILMDMYNVDKRYLNDKNFTTKKEAKEPYQPSQADMEIMQDQSPDYRVYNTTASITGDGATSYFHKSLGGYSGVKMKRYDELLTQIEEGNMAVIDMLNTKYFIIAGKDRQPHAQRNPDALGNAWFVRNYKLVPNADSEFASLTHFNPKETAIVNQEYSSYLPAHSTPDTTAFIRMDSYEPNDLVYATQSHTDQLAVFSEMYYKDGWNAYIDGKLVEHIRVNYILRGLLVPSGSHKVEFKFEPTAYATGEKISLAGSLTLLLGCIAIIFQQFRKPKE